MAGPSIIKLALLASTAFALPYNAPRDVDQPLDLQELSHLKPRGLAADVAPYPKYDAHIDARDLFAATSLPIPTGAASPTGMIFPTGTAVSTGTPAATGLLSGLFANNKKAKRDIFATPPTPTGWNPHATGFVPTGVAPPLMTGTAPMVTGTSIPVPSGILSPQPHAIRDDSDINAPLQKRQFEGPRKKHFRPRWDLFAAFDSAPTPTASGIAAPTGTGAPPGTMPPRPTGTS